MYIFTFVFNRKKKRCCMSLETREISKLLFVPYEICVLRGKKEKEKLYINIFRYYRSDSAGGNHIEK